MAEIEIAGRRIGPGEPAYVVAELSANHHGRFERAAELLQAAAAAGADAVKLQTYTPDTITLRSDRRWFRIGEGSPWAGRLLWELYEEAHMPWEWQPRLKELADASGIHLFSTPFDETAVDFLERMAVPAYKVASFELVDLPLLARVGSTGKPVILSTGMASLSEIEAAVSTLRRAGAAHIALLKCTSAYPSPPEEMNLRSIPRLAETFDVVAGLSDHTLDLAVPVAAVTLGARIIEKHLTLSRAEPGPDSGFSLEPGEFRAMVAAVRTAERALGEPSFGPGPAERPNLLFRRSLFVVEEVRAGDAFTSANVRSIRPGHGLPPSRLAEVLGRRAARDIEAGTPLSDDLIAADGD